MSFFRLDEALERAAREHAARQARAAPAAGATALPPYQALPLIPPPARHADVRRALPIALAASDAPKGRGGEYRRF
jgi:hypothetical protein